MTIQQMLLVGSAAGSYAGLLDNYTTNMYAAVGLSRLRSSTTYAGPCLRVRRSSDDAEQDIGFSGTALDTAALLSFVGANNGFVVTWYDQSGNSNDLTQATAANQPQIVDAGTYIGEMLFDNVNDSMSSPNAGTAIPATTMYFAGRLRTYDNSGGGFAEIHRWRGRNALGWARNTAAAGDYKTLAWWDDSGGAVQSQYSNSLGNDGTVYATIFDRANTNQCELHVNGVSGTGGFDGPIGGVDPAARVILLGGMAGRLAVSSLVAYEADDTTNLIAVSTILKPAIKTDGLTAYTSNLWGVYSTRRQIAGYAGACMRVRRSSDNAEQDIGFDATTHLWDTAALDSFAGVGEAYVKTFYDQSGGGHDLTQTTTANQPRVVNGGSVDPNGPVFDGTADCLVSGNSGTPTAFTAFIQGLIATTSACIPLEQSASIAANTGAMLSINGTGHLHHTNVALTHTDVNRLVYSSYESMLVGNVDAIRWDRSQVTAAAQTSLFSGGLLLTRALNSDAGTLPSGNFSALPWYVGARGDASSRTPMTLTTLAIYETAVSDADIERISRALG